MNKKLLYVLLFLIVGFGFLIRIYKVNNTALYGDEVDFGYQAYSFVKTGSDYFGNKVPIYFRSLSEWKTSAFIYTLSPFVAVLGIDNLSIRLPSILFGTLTLVFIYLLVKRFTDNDFIAVISAFFLAISPWHIHYSRIGFEASEMILTYIAGIYFFYKGLGIGNSLNKDQANNKWLFLSAFLLSVSFVIYRTQVVFVPTTLLVLVLIYRKELLAVSKKYLIFSSIIFLVISMPYAYQTFLGHGSERFSTLSPFNAEKMDNEIGILRLEDQKYQKNDVLTGITDKVFHNKYLYFSSIIATNFFKSYSTEFLFISGDTNPRQNIPNTGELYKYQFIFLLIGLFLFVDEKISKRNKILILSWLVFSPLAASLTRDGANHATRLSMMLLPLSFIFSYGVYFVYEKLKANLNKKIFLNLFIGISLLSLTNYLHTYFVHYPSQSEKWWQSGFKEAISSVMSEKDNFDKIIISSADEPAQIFFLAWSLYPPQDFQNNLFEKEINLKGFGKVAQLDKFLFPHVGVGKDLYSLPNDLPDDYLYLATAKEIGLDLVAEPERMPANLKLIKTITYPSGRPVFYLFSK